MALEFLSYKKAAVAYTQRGDGQSPFLFIFHGYAQKNVHFEALMAVLTQKYTVVCFDLPGHGATVWPYPSFTPDDVAAWVSYFLEKKAEKSCALLGFSFGARMVQTLAPRLGAAVSAVFLLAPDGFGTRSLQWVSWVPHGWRLWLLRRSYWHKTALFLSKNSLLPKVARRFLTYHNSSADWQRLAIFAASFDGFEGKKKDFMAFLNHYSIPFFLFLGKKDNIIPLSIGTKISQMYPKTTLKVIPTGHFLFGKHLNNAFSSILSTF